MEALINTIAALPAHADIAAAFAVTTVDTSADSDVPAGIAKSDGSRARKGKSTSKRKGKSAGKARVTKTANATATVKAPHAPKEKVAAFVLSEEQHALFQNVRVLIRKGTDNAFEIGSALDVLQPSIPEKSWGKVIKPLGLTTRSAWNYMSVARNLVAFRGPLVDADIGTTVLYQLARGPEAIVQFVIDAYLGGERLSVANVKRLVDDALGIVKKPKTSAIDVGGLAGIRQAAMEKLRADSAALIAVIKRIQVAVAEALKPLSDGKRVKKGALAEAITSDSRDAYQLIKSLAAPFDGRDFGKAPITTGWGAAQEVLYRMGGIESWPTKEALEPWLLDTVVPTLHFILSGETHRSGAEDNAPEHDDEVLIDVVDIVLEPGAHTGLDVAEAEVPEDQIALMTADPASEAAVSDDEHWRDAKAISAERLSRLSASFGFGPSQAQQSEAPTV